MSLFKTSKEAKEILESLRRTGIRPNLWARAAFGYSLSLESDIPGDSKFDSEGTEFQEKTFFGDDEAVLIALLRQKVKIRLDQDAIGAFVKQHVERGIRLLNKEYIKLGKKGDEFILQLLKMCPVEIQDSNVSDLVDKLLLSSPDVDSYELKFEIGISVNDGSNLYYTLNTPGSSPHIAIMGRNGTGKTRTGIKFLKSIKEEVNYNIPFLIFDFSKGDIASNDSFVELTGAKVIHTPDERIPLVPLSITVDESYAIELAARRFRDTICSVVPHLGPIQKERCLDILKNLYVEHNNSPDLENLLNYFDMEYQLNKWDSDSLLACIHEFTSFPLFRRSKDGIDHDFFKQYYIIDIHRLPEDLKKLTTFLILDKLYSEIMHLPDSPLDKKGNRLIRHLVIIDEAHHYLPCKQPTLINMVREVRSKGVGIWLLSQSPDDFDQSNYNFAKEMGLSIIFSCVLEKPRMLEAILGSKVDPKRLSHLGPGIALTRLPDENNAVEFAAWQLDSPSG